LKLLEAISQVITLRFGVLELEQTFPILAPVKEMKERENLRQTQKSLGHPHVEPLS